MVKVKIGTFNVENLFMRYNFQKNVDVEKFLNKGGPRPWLKAVLQNTNDIKGGQTVSTAKVIKENDPDVVALQEVEDMSTLKQFNGKKEFLNKRYRYALLIDANDPRFIDVAILSKFPISHIRTHQFDKDDNGRLIFSRDCLEVDIDARGKTLTLFVNHFKSKFMDNPDKRKKQARRVAEIIKARFGRTLRGNFAVLGDLNDTPDADTLRSLLGMNLENVIQTRVADPKERWTHVHKSKPSQLDYVLLSPALSRNSGGKPTIERRGLSTDIKLYKGPRFPGIGKDGTEASDHCAVFMDVEV